MAIEAGHIQLTEYNKEVIPKLNYMLEDLFCRYGVSIPYYLLDFSFPDYQIKADWPAPYTPEWLALYRPKLPPWPEIPWWDIPDWKLPEMEWPKFPWVEWPRLPDMPWPDIPPWPEWDIPPWDKPDFYWPEWDWPEWEEPEPLDKRKRRRRKRLIELITEIHKTKKISVGITLPKPPIEIVEETQILEYPGKPKWPLIQKPDWFEKTASDWPPDNNGFNFNKDRGEFGDDVTKINTLLEIIQDEAGVAVEQLNDLSPKSMELLNNIITEGYEEAPAVSADYTYNGQTKDGNLDKFGVSTVSHSAAWTAMEAYTPDVYDNVTNVVVMRAGYRKIVGPPIVERWGPGKDRAYISFDTSNLAGKTITAATLKLYISSITSLDDYETIRTVNLYGLAWGTLDASDWNGGTLTGSFEESALSAGAYYTITLTDTSVIDKTGETQFEIAFKADVDGTVITDPADLFVTSGVFYYRGGGQFYFNSGDNASNKPILTVTATG